MSVIKGFLLLLWDLIYFLTGEGSWKLRAHEKIVLEAAIESLPHEVRQLMRERLKGIVFVQRSHPQIARPRFYSALYTKDRRRIESGEYSNNLLRIQISVGEERQNADIEFFQGILDSIQFSRPAKFYAGKQIKVLYVGRGEPGLSNADVIDKREHGRHQ